MRPLLSRALFVAAAAVSVLACDALFGDPVQCSNDHDCAGIGGICTDGFCSASRGAPPVGTGGTDGGGPVPGQDGSVTPPGPIASLSLSPTVASIGVGLNQPFVATAKDANGAVTTAMLEWSVSGGGTIDGNGLFTAGPTEGGPFTVTAKSGAISATATISVTKAVMTTTVMIGETTMLDVDDNGNGNLVLAQEATLAQAATIKSLTLYIDVAGGKLRLGVYDAKGPNNGPGAKLAETDEVTPATGWNAVPVKTPVLLPAGNYWLAYAPETNTLGYHKAGNGTGKIAYFNQAYGPLPATFSTTPMTENEHWSFYATLTR